MDSSKLSSFYKLTLAERARILQSECGLTDNELRLLQNTGSLPLETANTMVENAVASVPGVGMVNVNLVWDPPWSPDRMSDEARLVLNMW